MTAPARAFLRRLLGIALREELRRETVLREQLDAEIAALRAQRPIVFTMPTDASTFSHT